MLFDFGFYYITIVINKVLYWQKNRHIKQSRKPRNRPAEIWSKEQRQYNEAKIVFSTNNAGATRYPYAKEKRCDHTS